MPAGHPTISVVMSVYNGERYLSAAIESVLRQTFSDFEFIIINDGSCDRTAEILAGYARKDKRLCFFNRENRGLAASLNEGIAYARGQWIARMDADDICMKNRFSNQLNWLRHTGADVCGGRIRLFNSGFFRTRRYPTHDDAIKLQLCLKSAFAHPAVVMRSALAKRLCYDTAKKHCEDYELWTRLAISGAKMTNLQETVLLYRVHLNQVSQIYNKIQISCREMAQKNYVEQMIQLPNAFDVMSKFSSPFEEPNNYNAEQLKDILMEISWASPTAKLYCFLDSLKYVRPSNRLVYGMYEKMRRDLGLSSDFSSIPLFVQTRFKISTDTWAYNFIKRFF